MKYFLLLFFLIAFHNESKFDYNLLTGSWRQKSFANTTDTAIFTFGTDSIAKLEMRKSDTDDLIASVTGKYSIDKKQNTLLITILGRPKTFNVIALKADVLTIKNTSENKDAQTFERIKSN
jgi:hypothetical protein